MLGLIEGISLKAVDGSKLGSADGPADISDGIGVGVEDLPEGAPVSNVIGNSDGCRVKSRCVGAGDRVGVRVNGFTLEDRRDEGVLPLSPLPLILLLDSPLPHDDGDVGAGE